MRRRGLGLGGEIDRGAARLHQLRTRLQAIANFLIVLKSMGAASPRHGASKWSGLSEVFQLAWNSWRLSTRIQGEYR